MLWLATSWALDVAALLPGDPAVRFGARLQAHDLALLAHQRADGGLLVLVRSLDREVMRRRLGSVRGKHRTARPPASTRAPRAGLRVHT